LHPGARYDVEHHKCKWNDDVVTNKHLKTSHKKNRKELQKDVVVEELTNPHTSRNHSKCN
jgi:hypothetical protein